MNLEQLRERLIERANDSATLGQTVNPSNINGAKGALLHLADLLLPEPLLKHTPDPVKKRRTE
jgi:hypothetical protein